MNAILTLEPQEIAATDAYEVLDVADEDADHLNWENCHDLLWDSVREAHDEQQREASCHRDELPPLQVRNTLLVRSAAGAHRLSPR